MVTKWRIARWALVFIALVVVLYSGAQIARYVWDGYSSNKLNSSLKKEFHAYDTRSSGPGRDRFGSLLKVNKDIVGWITIPGTKVDYPVVQATDNAFYLTRNFKKERSSHGSIFMDYRNTGLEDRNTIIYGHHMKDGTMFGAISGYKNRSYLKGREYIQHDSLEQPEVYQIFSVYVYRPGKGSLRRTFASDSEYSQYLGQISRASLYDTGTSVESTDKILTLVTCSYEFADARLVIHAKRVLNAKSAISK